MLLLPAELRAQIIESLPVKDVYKSVALVCKGLHDDVCALSATRHFFVQVAQYVLYLLETGYNAARYELSGPDLPDDLDSFVAARRGQAEVPSGALKHELDKWYFLTFSDKSGFKSAAAGASLHRGKDVKGLVAQYHDRTKKLTALTTKFRCMLLMKHDIKAPASLKLASWTTEEFRSFLLWKLTIQYWKHLPPIKVGDRRSKRTSFGAGQCCDCRRIERL